MSHLPIFDRDLILRTRRLKTLWQSLTGLAFQFAVLGRLSTARELISMINLHHPCYDRESSLILQPLWVAWDATGEWPTGEFEKVKEDQKPISDRAEAYAKELWSEAGILEEDRRYDEHGLRKLVERLKETDPDALDPDALSMSTAMRSTSALLTKALEVAIASQEKGITPEEGLPDTDQVLKWISTRLHVSTQLSSLVKSAKAWGTLKDGVLARAVGVNDDKIREFTLMVMETFKQRFAQGPRNPDLEKKSTAELVRIISDNTVNNAGARTDYGESGLEEYPTTSNRDPLSSTQISNLEKGLNISLPEDYKEFLSCTDGLEPSWSGLMMDPPLYPAEDVEWLGRKNNSLTDIPIELLDILVFHIDHSLDDDEWPEIGRAIEIGNEDVFLVWMLPPDRVKCARDAYRRIGERDEKVKAAVDTSVRSFCGPEDEFEKLGWCTMTWDASRKPMEAYPSFRAFLDCIKVRAASFQRLSIRCVEPLQVVNYEVNGYYNDHFDWLGDTCTSYWCQAMGDRSSSIFVYLEAECTGGETKFLEMSVPEDIRNEWCDFVVCEEVDGTNPLKWKPKAGDAVFWENLDGNGRGIEKVRHAGLPVNGGVEDWLEYLDEDERNWKVENSEEKEGIALGDDHESPGNSKHNEL